MSSQTWSHRREMFMEGLNRRMVKFRIRVYITFNSLAVSCRMYRQKPQEEAPLCGLCAHRGGHLRCRRSHKLIAELKKTPPVTTTIPDGLTVNELIRAFVKNNPPDEPVSVSSSAPDGAPVSSLVSGGVLDIDGPPPGR